MSKYKLWANVQNHQAIEFMAVLKQQNHQWAWADNSAEANLWCVCADGSDLSRVAAYYEILSNKPSVAYLSTVFTSMPYDEWVFFPIPLNINILHKWLVAKNLSVNHQEKPWLHDIFKINHWPNISNYAGGGSEIMMVCSLLLNRWCRYEELLEYKIDSGMLDVMLTDAASEGNLVFKPVDQPNQTANDVTSKSNLLLKRLFGRFSIKTPKVAETS